MASLTFKLLDAKAQTPQQGNRKSSSKHNPVTTPVTPTDELTSCFTDLREQLEDQLEAVVGKKKRPRFHKLSEENDRAIMWKQVASAEPIILDKKGALDWNCPYNPTQTSRSHTVLRQATKRLYKQRLSPKGQNEKNK